MAVFKNLLGIGLIIVLAAASQTSQAQQTALQQRCSELADARGLHGQERREFRARCKEPGGQAATSAVHQQPKKETASKPAETPKRKQVASPAAAPRNESGPTSAPIVPATAPSSGVRISTPTDFGRRIALVIGNSAYKNVPMLSNPQHDAVLVADALRRSGFETVTLQTDLEKEGLINALRHFAQQAEAYDWAVIYYAGHGMEIGGVNYLIPVDAKIASDRDITFEAVPLNQVLNAAERAKRLRLVILDACRDNPFANQMKRTLAGASRSVSRGLASVEPDAGTLVVYAAKDGETALDGNGENSPFAAAFVNNLRTPGLEVRRLFDLVRDDVMAATENRQKPFSYGSISGRQDFYFVSR